MLVARTVGDLGGTGYGATVPAAEDVDTLEFPTGTVASTSKYGG